MKHIVTAFRNIGRSNWEGPNLPSYLKRTVDDYFERFERLLVLDNPIIVFADQESYNRLLGYTKQKPNLVVVLDSHYPNCSKQIYDGIARVQNLPSFKETIRQPYNPEYWSQDYVMINLLKSWYVNRAYELGFVTGDDLTFWCDFGYPRKAEDISPGLWECDYFDKDKIHVFSHRDLVPTKIDIRNIIDHNEVYLQGCHIGADHKNWKFLEKENWKHIKMLLANDLVDDDQSILLMTYIKNKDRFYIHYTMNDYWFCLFTQYNNANI